MLFRNGRMPRPEYRSPHRSVAHQANAGVQISRPQQASKVRCNKCGSEVSTMAIYCHACGQKFTRSQI